VLFRHVLRNALIPILTTSVAFIPLLFMGSLITESFFSIPGPRQLPDRGDRRAGLRDRARDGVHRLGALHPRLDPDRHQLQLGGPADPAAMSARMKPVFLLTDLFLFALVIAGGFYIRYVLRAPQLRANWRLALQRPAAAVSAVVLGFFLLVALADSLHYRRAGPPDPKTGARVWAVETRSALDFVLGPIANAQERTYSSPLAWLGFRKETFERDGKVVRDYPRLKYGGAHLSDPDSQWAGDVAWRSLAGLAGGALAWALSALAILAVLAKRSVNRLVPCSDVSREDVPNTRCARCC
jgi:hypothetical protein